MKNGENCDVLGPKENRDIQSAKGGTLREGGSDVANNFSASDFSTPAHGAGASSVREGEGERGPFAMTTERRRARVRAYLAAMHRLAGASGRSWGLPLRAAARWASLMVERDQATAVDELGREWRSAVASLALGGDETATAVLKHVEHYGMDADGRCAHWMVMGCALSALAAASLGLLVESAELLPLPEDGRAAWDAWAAAVDPAAMLWARHAFGWLPGRLLPCADVVFESCGGGR